MRNRSAGVGNRYVSRHATRENGISNSPVWSDSIATRLGHDVSLTRLAATRQLLFINPRSVLAEKWRVWKARLRQRAALRDIADDPHLLADLGLTRDEALAQANKPFGR